MKRLPDLPTIVITTLAEYQTVFWAPVCETLLRAGLDVFVLAFDDRSAEILEARNVPVARMAGLAGASMPGMDSTFASRIAAYGIDNPNLWFSHERVVFRIRDTAALQGMFMRYSNAVESVLDNLQSEGRRLIMLQELGGFLSNITSYYGARRRGIDNWFIEPSFFRGRLFFLKNQFSAIEIPGPIAADVSAEVSHYVSDTLKRRAIVIPTKDRHQYTSVLKKLVNWKNAKRLVEKLYDKHLLGKHQDFGHIGVHVRAHAEMAVNAMRGRSLYTPLENIGPFIYYPLHVPGDMALTLRSPEYLDQLALVDYLLRVIPATHLLAIKEHPAQVGALRYGRLRALYNRYDNLFVLPPTTNNFDVIEKAAAVISVNSKSGAEALLLGKPVIVLGDAFYSRSPLVSRVSLPDVGPALATAVREPGPPSELVRRYFQTVFNHSLPGELYVTHPDNVKTFSRTVQDALFGSSRVQREIVTEPAGRA